jgi:FlaA1/EpsC-like NDP-sugar epimerase
MGMRPREKLFEELFYPEEVVRTSCPKIKKARNVLCGWGELEAQLDDLRATLYVDGASPIRAKIKQIIPEYSYCPAEICPFPEESLELRKSAMGA